MKIQFHEKLINILFFSFPTTNSIMEDLKEIVFDKLIPATQMLQLRFNYHYQHNNANSVLITVYKFSCLPVYVMKELTNSCLFKWC